MPWHRATWYWPTEHGCWHLQYDLCSWMIGGRVYLGDVEVHVGPVSFGWSNIL